MTATPEAKAIPGLIELNATTLFNATWLEENKAILSRIFPETWTHPSNINWLALRYQLKLHGIDFRSDEQLASILAQFERLGIVKRDGLQIRRAIP